MPVTLKLSKKFYEAFGEQVANELVDAFNQVDATYRSDLKEMNETNFARSDAKMETRFAQFEQRFAQFEARMEQRYAQFESRMEQRFAQFETKMEQRFAQFETKMEQRFTQFEATFGAKMEQGFKDQTRFMLLAWATILAAVIATR